MVLLSSPADAVMMPELKSFTANATPEIHKKFKITKLTYVYICHHGKIVTIIHYHKLSKTTVILQHPNTEEM